MSKQDDVVSALELNRAKLELELAFIDARNYKDLTINNIEHAIKSTYNSKTIRNIEYAIKHTVLATIDAKTYKSKTNKHLECAIKNIGNANDSLTQSKEALMPRIAMNYETERSSKNKPIHS